MDQGQPGEQDRIESGEATVPRRAFFNRARLGLLAVAGVMVFGVATSTGRVTADEESSDEKKKKNEPRDKDRETKEKEKLDQEKEERQKEKKSKKSTKNNANTSNTKKKKSKNGDNSQKKKVTEPAAPAAPVSPYAKYLEKGKDQYGCTAFPNQFDAQQVLRIEPKDPNNLDGNRNGIACDGQDAFMDGVAGGLMNPPFDLNPVSRP